MFDFFYFLFIFPLENLLALVFGAIFAFFKSEVVAIVLLSVLVNLFLFKILNRAETKAKREAMRKAKLDERISRWKTVYSSAKVFAFTQTLYRQNHYHPIFALSTLGGLAIQVPFFLGVYFLVTNHRWADLGSLPLSGANFLADVNFALGFNFLPIAMTLVTLTNVFLSNQAKSARIQGTIIAFLFLILLYPMPSILVLYWTSNMLFSLLKTLFYKNKEIKHFKIPKPLFWAILNISFLITFFAPVALYNSDVFQFESAETLATITALFGEFLLFSFLLIYACYFIPQRFYKTITFILMIILFVGILNNFIFVGNYGPMDKLTLQITPTLFPENSLIKLLISLFLGVVFFIFLKKPRVLQILFCTILIVSIVEVFSIAEKRLAFAQNNHKEKTNETTPFENELFSYAKNEKNIVVIVLDMFTGSHMADILEQFPELKTTLSGFVHFPNAISSGNATVYSMPSIVGGPFYTIYAMNERHAQHDITEAAAYHNIGKAFAAENFNTAFLMYPILKRKELINDKNMIWIDNNQPFSNYFFEKHPELKSQYTQREGFEMTISKMLGFGLFRFAPEYFLRAKIYNNGKWLIKKENFADVKTMLERSAPLYTLTHTGNTNAQKPNFKFFYTNMTHSPYFFGIDENNQCTFFSTKTIWKRNLGTPHSARQYETEVCAFFYLKHYIEWLKKENIYDNTQIFLVSDHAGFLNSINIPLLKPVEMDLGQDILFLFKDFNTNGELKTDERLMANYDISGIFCENLTNGCLNVPPNILKNYPQNRTIIHTRQDGPPAHDATVWNIYSAYKIKAPIDDPASYEDVSAQYANAGEYARRR